MVGTCSRTMQAHARASAWPACNAGQFFWHFHCISPRREVEARSEAEVAQLLEAGNVHRAVASHNLNDASSRSHAICTLQARAPLKPAHTMQMKASALRRLDASIATPVYAKAIPSCVHAGDTYTRRTQEDE